MEANAMWVCTCDHDYTMCPFVIADLSHDNEEMRTLVNIIDNGETPGRADVERVYNIAA